jgi:phosphoribosylformylglycinamidine synthase
MSEVRLRFGIVVFPGSNCDHDAYHVCKHILGQDAVFLWHKDPDLKNADVVILPGGFSYGDYLRCGAIARFSPVMRSVIRFAGEGGIVAGICNGFQILVEAGLLPGALIRNASLKFSCRFVNLRVENAATAFTEAYAPGQVLAIPIAHGEGNYTCDGETLAELERSGRILFRYCDAAGAVRPAANPNGSLGNIAGIINATGTVMGMMPHPERASDPVLRTTDGIGVFRSILHHAARRMRGTPAGAGAAQGRYSHG